MKKTKRLLALLLTLVSIVSLLAFPAAVAEHADCVAPHVYATQCPFCVDGVMYKLNGVLVCTSCGATM